MPLRPRALHSSSCRGYFQVPADVAKLGWAPADASEVDWERNRNVKSLSRRCRLTERWPERDPVFQRGQSALSRAAMSATLSSEGAVTARGEALVGLASATKRFGGVVAIRDVTFDLVAGEVLALLGENGAGKSTCVKLLAGVYQPDAGAVLIDGRPAENWSPLDASRAGIAVMHQHPGLFGDLSVCENIYLGHMPRTRLGGVDRERMRRWLTEGNRSANGVSPLREV